ncbi:hypothetical protein KFK09_024230 [Dendrobium nobile]|uniref:Uncharacterized protein n=1 Tax=Dendrobium nobile TaxID=94219 RepID=A0A8T3AD86_DENNO|nr:hypothetical protein KFK09_024230 [Dendrobium nobile]
MLCECFTIESFMNLLARRFSWINPTSKIFVSRRKGHSRFLIGRFYVLLCLKGSMGCLWDLWIL